MSVGHKKPNCPGHWVDISTMVDRDRQMCSVCRATRKATTDEEILEAKPVDDLEIPGPPSWLIWALISTNTILAIGVAMVLARTFVGQ